MPIIKRVLLQSNEIGEDSGRRRRHHLHSSRQPRIDREETSEEEENEEIGEGGEGEEYGQKDIKDDEVGGEGGEDEVGGEAEGRGELEDSEDSPSSSSGEKPEFIYIDLTEIRKEVQCPICLGIIKKTRTVMECLHRFCRECIDKSMRLGNKECPACRKHCASRRSLRDDPKFDALIAILYPDIDKYEEEELALHEGEKTRNEEIQASIAEIFQRQTEALSRPRVMGKDAASGFVPRPQRNLRTAHSRRKRNSCAAEPHAYEDDEEEIGDNGGKGSSSMDESPIEVRRRKKRKHTGARSSLPSSSADGGSLQNETEANKESRRISPGPVWNPEMLAWGRGGTRSNTRHGGANGSSKTSRNTRLSKLIEHLRSSEETNEVDIHFMLVSLDKKAMPGLRLPHVHCRSSLMIRHLHEYIALQTALQASEVEILVPRNLCRPNLTCSTFLGEDGGHSSLEVNVTEEELQLVEETETLASIRANYSSTNKHLILVYRQRKSPAIS
ncbi:hypothetical protein SAY87_030715 [Trapa incisa]|uniref:RING-type domain-containing protein n=1 Tax=Trapa incisa TaxID=236973 RepID=A0AAN7KTL9_9MYRT|nr:hypothetical protein SAY87_030715 [Trapa incisa]